MKTLSAPAMAAIRAGTAREVGAVAILCSDPVHVWGGYGTLPLGAPPEGGDFIGLGHRSLITVTGAALGSVSQGLSLSLSGVDPQLLEMLDATDLRRAPVIIWRLIFDSSGTQLLDAPVYKRGRVDRAPLVDIPGGEATIKVEVEDASRGLGRRGQRMRTDADQRLIDPTDGFFKHVSYAAEKKLYWAGKKPANAGQALSGGAIGAIVRGGQEANSSV